MAEIMERNQALRTVASVLIRCFFISTAVLLFWLAIVMFAGDWAYGWHSRFIPVSRDHFNLVHYAGMTLFKTGVFVLFLVPYIAIRMVLGNEDG